MPARKGPQFQTVLLSHNRDCHLASMARAMDLVVGVTFGFLNVGVLWWADKC